MANKTLFGSKPNIKLTNIFNNAGGTAYQLSDMASLAQVACTNCFNGTFYVSAEDNLKVAKDIATKLKGDPEFLAKTALYARQKSNMKDMPAFLMVVLADANPTIFHRVFHQVIDDGKMLRNFVQIATSGATGRKFNISAGTVRRAIQEWFDKRTATQIFWATIGNDPSIKDVLKMAHPRPNNAEKAALFAYINECEFDENRRLYNVYRYFDGTRRVAFQHPFSSLPNIVQQYENYKHNGEGEVPKVDFRLLDSLKIGTNEWIEIARNANFSMTRMNLNTFARHGVFKNREMVKIVADRLKNAEEIGKSRLFPYQLLMAWKATEGNSEIPFEVRDALQDAMETAINNVPTFKGKVAVLVDTSGSMQKAITGERKGSTSKVSCVDVAGLIAASIVRRNPSAIVVPFDTSVHIIPINGRDSVMTNAQKLARNGGGTNCACAMEYLNRENAQFDAVIYVSDNESWVDSRGHFYGGKPTGTMEQWSQFKRSNRGAKLVCIDLTPNTTSQTVEKEDILQIGGFSDSVFDVIATFIEYGHNKNHWVSEIEKITI